MNAMRILSVGKLISECWATAEDSLRKEIHNKLPDRDEEIITTLFHAELEAQFKKVSGNGAVARAFLSDLRLGFPRARETALFNIAGGVIATVSFHPRSVERVTGGDLGLVLVRPDIRSARYDESVLNIDHDYRRGLLTQAKMLKRDSRWSALSANQKRVLQTKLSYLAFLLYRYVDQDGDRRTLAPFAWQLARNATIQEIGRWLASGQFPDLHDSCRILRRLSSGEIGTDDKEIIAKHIAPPMRPSLEIKIHWRDGRGPGSSVRLRDSTAHIQQHVVQRAR